MIMDIAYAQSPWEELDAGKHEFPFILKVTFIMHVYYYSR